MNGSCVTSAEYLFNRIRTFRISLYKSASAIQMWGLCIQERVLIKCVVLTSNQQSWAWCVRLKIYFQHKMQVFQLKADMLTGLQNPNMHLTHLIRFFFILTLNFSQFTYSLLHKILFNTLKCRIIVQESYLSKLTEENDLHTGNFYAALISL